MRVDECYDRVSVAATQDFLDLAANLLPNQIQFPDPSFQNIQGVDGNPEDGPERWNTINGDWESILGTTSCLHLINVLFKLRKLPEAIAKSRDLYHKQMKLYLRKVTRQKRREEKRTGDEEQRRRREGG